MPQARPSTATSVDQASNPYATLGITRTASLDEIRAAWKRAALKTHPDRTFDDGSAFRAVQAAYEKLMSSVSSASSVSRWAAPRPAEPADKWTAHQRAERQHATVERQRSERQRQERERAEAARAASKLAEERARYSAHKTYAERARAFAAEEQMRREAHKAARGKTWADRLQERHQERYRSRFQRYVGKNGREAPSENTSQQPTPQATHRSSSSGDSASTGRGCEMGEEDVSEKEWEGAEPSEEPTRTSRPSLFSPHHAKRFEQPISPDEQQKRQVAAAQAEEEAAAETTTARRVSPSEGSRPPPRYFSTRTRWHLVYHEDRRCLGLLAHYAKQLFEDDEVPAGLDPCPRCCITPLSSARWARGSAGGPWTAHSHAQRSKLAAECDDCEDLDSAPQVTASSLQQQQVASMRYESVYEA
jgi:curved DNA-binding protein CbpA